jgi:MEMO1 family protein
MAIFSRERDNIIRKTAVAGRFYPADRQKLLEEVKACFERAKPSVRQGKMPQALIVPHAGYIYSGSVAASGFNQLPADAEVKRIFLLASSHQMHFPGASVYCSGDYETPLGVVTVDRETGHRLIQTNNLFSDREDAHLFEHSLEVQLPFLQVKPGSGFTLIPIVLGTQKPEECRQMAQTLKPFLVPGNLFVISSDFSHYPDYDGACGNDQKTIDAILTGSPGELLRTLEENKRRNIPGLVTSLCGWTSVLTLMYMTEDGPFDFERVDYQNSGDQPVYGDHERVVGYSAMAVYHNSSGEFQLTVEEREQLLRIADESIRSMAGSGKSLSPDPSTLKGSIARCAGAFVSIYIAGKLRGCIGSFENENTLAEVVSRSAASAARDSRFDPVSGDELDKMTLEISVLTPLKRIYSKEEIIPGKHGIYIRKGLNSGTFLPQVGVKNGWSPDEFLGRCSRDKAGLGWDGWKNAELFTYEAIIFGSSKGGGENNSGKTCSV